MRVARVLRGRSEDGADEGDAVPAARPTQDVPRVDGVAGLHPDDPRVASDQVVAVHHGSHLGSAGQGLPRRAHDPGEPPVAKQHPGEVGEVGGVE